MRTTLDYARAYVTRGAAVIPIPLKTKRPVLEGWQNLRLSAAELPKHFAGAVNIGVLTGEPSGWLVDVDCDAREAIAVALDLLPPTPMVHGHGAEGKARSKPRSHYWYRSEVATKKYRFAEMDPNHPGARLKEPTMLVELRSTGCQTIVPPSVHPSGENLCWDRVWGPDDHAQQGVPAEILPADLERAVAKVAAAALLARHWPGTGTRDEAAMALCGMLARAGWPDEEIDAFARITAQAAGDEQWRQRSKARQSRAGLAAGKSITGAPTLAQLLIDGEQVVDKVREWLTLKQSAEQPNMPTDAKLPKESHRETKGTLTRGGHLSTVNLATVQPESVRWLWPGYIPLGKVTVLDGDPGLGKSLLTLDLAARVTTGRDMPDGTRGVSGAVVLLSAEDDLADTIRPRLDAAGADVAKVTALEAVGDVDLETGEVHERPVFLPQDIPALCQAIEEHGALLAVIDPLMAFLDGDVNAHRDQDVRRALRPLAQCAQETGAAIVVIRHLNKAPGGKAIYRGGGSIGIVGAARSALLVAEDPDDENKRVMARVKSNLAAPVPALRYQLAQNADGVVSLEWLGPTEHTATSLLAAPTDSEERSATEECTDWLRDLLEEHGGWIAVKDAQREAQKAGYTDKVLRSARVRLCGRSVKEGFGSAGQWVWRLRPATERAAKVPSEPKMPKDATTQNVGALDNAGHLSSNGHHPQREPQPAGDGSLPSAAYGRYHAQWMPRHQELRAKNMPEREALAQAVHEQGEH